ncbi:MAG TPA: GspL/Epsl periplasmic domain-containing protein, partial [Deltaproteobacteria bacterium]|nr:GspL/Epsl periplasmic domain-containing protein [Deltaproteobacteria bacterium]
VNFRQGELGVKMRLGMLMGAAGPWVKAACVLLVLWVAGLVLDVSLKARTSAELDRKIKAEFSTVMPKGTPMVDPVTQMEQHLKRLKAMAGGSRETGAGTPLEVLKDLSAGLPSGMDLTIDTLTMDDQSITISGSTAKYDDVERIQAVLAGLSYVKDVKILSANVDKNDQKVKMRITCRRQV